ncbi:COG4315 family predicted lipoprotein [Halorussus salinus]|uniref:COG4315 family predicted lipoprotein n=1 Tax=Halorussus salinus TaxID=1364935 RepID=UPI001092EC74|nr:hypothetical protein [Halorussus salinus]
MALTRRTLLRASGLGLVGSSIGFAGASENRQETETTGRAQETTTQQEETRFTLQVTTHPEYGVVLTDGEGMTLYRFTQDEGGESTCYDQCAEAWPPLTVEESPTVPDGLVGDVGTTEREDGSRQVTYNGMPLYTFAEDQRPDDANGQGVGDAWFVVNPACPGAAETTTESGREETEATTESGRGGTETTTTSGGGGPY